MPVWLTPAAAKFWVGALGAILVAVATALGDRTPVWLPVVISALTALGVYLTPNRDVDAYTADPFAVDVEEDVV